MHKSVHVCFSHQVVYLLTMVTCGWTRDSWMVLKIYWGRGWIVRQSAAISQTGPPYCTTWDYWGNLNYCVRHPVCVQKNWQILSTWIEFSKNVYAYLLKAPSHNQQHTRFFFGFHYLREMPLNRSRQGEWVQCTKTAMCYCHICQGNDARLQWTKVDVTVGVPSPLGGCPIVITLSVCLSVRPSVCPSKNFNIGHNFFTLRDKSFIFGMCDPYDKTFPTVP